MIWTQQCIQLSEAPPHSLALLADGNITLHGALNVLCLRSRAPAAAFSLSTATSLTFHSSDAAALGCSTAAAAAADALLET